MSNKYIKLAVIAGVIILADQITKALIVANIPMNASVTIIPGFFDLAHYHNPGGAFGFLANQSIFIRKLFFLGMSSFAICIVFYFYVTTPTTDRFLSFGFAIIFGGALGNMIDRVRIGEVVDFLEFQFSFLPIKMFNPWPAFNVADSMISTGIGIFIFYLLFMNKPDNKKLKTDKAGN